MIHYFEYAVGTSTAEALREDSRFDRVANAQVVDSPAGPPPGNSTFVVWGLTARILIGVAELVLGVPPEFELDRRSDDVILHEQRAKARTAKPTSKL